MLIIKTNIFEKINNNITSRKLYSEEFKDYSCEKAGSRLRDKYDGDFDEEMGELKDNLNDAEESLVDYLRDNSYSNIKPYLKRIGIYIAFLCLAVIFIGFWIAYCSCCGANCCLFSPAHPSPQSTKSIFLLSGIITNILVIAFSIVILCLISPFFSRINGCFCSLLLLLHHINYGINPDYPLHAGTWEGLAGISKKFNESGKMIDTIDADNIDNLFSEAFNLCNQSDSTCNCNSTDMSEDYEFFLTFYELFHGLRLSQKAKDYLESKKIIDDSVIDKNDDIYDIMHDLVNTHIKRLCIAIFIITLCLAILAIIFLILYYLKNSEIFRILYIIIWNISMLFAILAIVVSAIYGTLGYFLSDTVQIIHYILSEKNTLNEDPILFNNKKQYLADLIEICANGDGTLTKGLSEFFLAFGEIVALEFEETKNEIGQYTCNNNVKSSMYNFYDNIENGTLTAFRSGSNIFNISCEFAKNDKNIILNEFESAGKRATVLSAFQFLVGVLLGISVLVGILLVHKYNSKKYIGNEENDVNITQIPKDSNNKNESIDYMNNSNKL